MAHARKIFGTAAACSVLPCRRADDDVTGVGKGTKRNLRKVGRRKIGNEKATIQFIVDLRHVYTCTCITIL